MHVRSAAAGVLLLLAFLVRPGHASAQQPGRITLAEAVNAASANNPDVRAAEAELAVARGRIAAARTLSNNPELSLSAGPAHTPDTSLTSYQVGVSQRFELGGKRGARTRSAESLAAAANARVARRRQEAMRRAERAYVLAVLADARVKTAVEAETVATQMTTVANERLALGAGTLLEVNVATAALGRERRARLDAERVRASALIELGAVVGRAASEPVEPANDLPSILGIGTAGPSDTGFTMLAAPMTLPEDSLVQVALTRRDDLAAARSTRDAAAADLRLARALAVPDPSVGISTGKAEDFRVTYFSLSLPLPLWNRGQGNRAQATAALDLAQLAEAQTRRQIEREVREAYRAYVKAREAEAAFDRQTVERLSENLALASESFLAGKIGLLAFNTVRRDLVDALLAYLDALAELVERHMALELAISGPLER